MDNNKPDILDLEIPLGVIGRNPKEALDYKLAGFSVANLDNLEPVDWEEGFECADLPDEDQGTSGSCTEQAFCYDFMNKHGIDLSRRDGYSRIFHPDGGAYAHEPYWKYDTEGQHTRENCPDPVEQTEENMREPVNIDAPRNKDFKVRYWSPPNLDIDTIARMIKTYNGMTGCFYLTGEGWKNRRYPRAPLREDKNWRGSHMIWLRGYKLYKGEKKIIADSSWYPTDNHYIGEDYFNINSQYAHSVYASEYRKVLSMAEYIVIEYNGKLGIGIFDGGFIEAIAWAKDKQQILDLCKAYSVTPVGFDENGYPLPTHSIKKIR